MKTRNQIILSIVLLLVNAAFIFAQTLVPINSNGTGSNPSTLEVFNELMYFIASDENYTNVLYYIDGNNPPEIVSSSPEFLEYERLTLLESCLIFSGDIGFGKKVFKISSPTEDVLGISGDYYDPSDFIEYEGESYFVGKNLNDESAIFQINEQNEAEQIGSLVHDYIREEQPFGAPNPQKNIFIANNRLCYLSTDGVFYIDLDDPMVTRQVINSDNYNFHYFGGDYTSYQLGNTIFFQEGVSSNAQLLKVDLTDTNPQMERIVLNPSKSSLPRHFIEFNGYLFFTAVEDLFDQVIGYYNPTTDEYKFDVINNKSAGSMGFADDDPFYSLDSRLFFYDDEIIVNNNGIPELIDEVLCIPNQALTCQLISLDDQYYYIGLTPGDDFIYDLYSCDTNIPVKETCFMNGHSGISSYTVHNDMIYIVSSIEPDGVKELFKWPEEDGNGLCQDAVSTNELWVSESCAIFPNPVDDKLFVESSSQHVVKLKIFNSTGRLYKHLTLEPSTDGRYSISTANFSQGFYFIKAIYENGNFDIFKIVAQRP